MAQTGKIDFEISYGISEEEFIKIMENLDTRLKNGEIIPNSAEAKAAADLLIAYEARLKFSVGFKQGQFFAEEIDSRHGPLNEAQIQATMHLFS